MTNIDETTGLPTLPDKHYWVVARGSSNVDTLGKRFYPQLLLMRTYEVEEQFGFFNLKTKIVEKSVVLDREFFTRIEDNFDSFRAGIQIKDWRDLTEETILQAAIKMLDRREEQEKYDQGQREKAQAAEHLIGTYPPNKLEKR